jgi:hypothetical protein
MSLGWKQGTGQEKGWKESGHCGNSSAETGTGHWAPCSLADGDGGFDFFQFYRGIDEGEGGAAKGFVFTEDQG